MARYHGRLSPKTVPSQIAFEGLKVNTYGLNFAESERCCHFTLHLSVSHSLPAGSLGAWHSHAQSCWVIAAFISPSNSWRLEISLFFSRIRPDDDGYKVEQISSSFTVSN